jgi:hypothetical protein
MDRSATAKLTGVGRNVISDAVCLTLQGIVACTDAQLALQALVLLLTLRALIAAMTVRTAGALALQQRTGR